MTGITESNAKITSRQIDDQERTSLDELNLLSVFPAWMATNEGGATPRKVPTKNLPNGTSMTGEAIFMNQLGRNGVIRKKMM